MLFCSKKLQLDTKRKFHFQTSLICNQYLKICQPAYIRVTAHITWSSSSVAFTGICHATRYISQMVRVFPGEPFYSKYLPNAFKSKVPMIRNRNSI